jgi:hypothetical protein
MDNNHMKQQAYQGCSKFQFSKGDHVFLHLQPYKKISLKVDHCQKLARKFYDPYTILKCVGPVTYNKISPMTLSSNLFFMFLA